MTLPETFLSQDLVVGILIGMVVMLALDHLVFPVVAKWWAGRWNDRRHRARPVSVDRRHPGGS